MMQVIDLSGPIKIKHYFVYPTEEENKREMEIFDIVNVTRLPRDNTLAFVTKVNYKIGNNPKWVVGFRDDRVERSDGIIIYPHYKENDKSKYFKDYVEAIKFVLDKLFIDAI